ncbi:rRNA maturation RNase YbeY [Candidatus Pelagibacter sp.]|nr:rRNA maturation RNase YbeY [Candidatus Pelagibacter sp.]
MININVFSEEKSWSKKLKKKEFFFNKICKAFPKKYQFLNKKVSLTLLLSNNRNIKKLNKNFRKKNKSTDILSFPSTKKLKISKQSYFGDIIISYNFIDKPKSQPLKNFREKLIKTFIHGFLHLLGFDHIKNKDYLKMLKEEERIYQSVISKLN